MPEDKIECSPDLPKISDFSDAFKKLKEGRSVARKGWRGAEMSLKMKTPDVNSKMTQPFFYLIILNCEEGIRRMLYTPTLTDIFAEDWVVID